MDVLRRQPVWLLLAVSSGACAAINGVFAKLTTTELTNSLASSLSSTLGLSPSNTIVNLLLRGTFFGLNLLFNVAMWTLFTAALTRSSSTTRVSIVNVSMNFVVTAFAGAIIFGEKLGGWWWVGAAFLAAGNVVIGRGREDGEKKVNDIVGSELAQAENDRLLNGDNEEQGQEEGDVIDLGEELVETHSGERKEAEDEERLDTPSKQS